MTEEQAKTKWCPFTRGHTAGAPNIAVNRGFGDSGDVAIGACIASACMAWRIRHQWLDNAQQDPDWVSYYPYAFEPGPGHERDDGYCGLAGAAS